jgi:hypothetical protein
MLSGLALRRACASGHQSGNGAIMPSSIRPAAARLDDVGDRAPGWRYGCSGHGAGGRAPFSPEAVVEEFCNELKRYRVTAVVGDRFGGEWPRERFLIHGHNYQLAELAKSDLYTALLPLINSRGVDLLEDDRLVHQLVGLERRTARGGRDTIDHPRGAHDDICNAVAGAAQLAATKATSWAREKRKILRSVPPDLSGSGDGTGWLGI